jgi:1-acyl-sn-glycerol-3-phosphate acyltransferase
MIISILYYVALILFLIVYAVLISLAWALTVWWDRKRAVISAMTYIHAMMLFWLAPGWKVRVQGEEHFDRAKPYVIICNHRGMFDIPLMYAIRPNIRWVAKRELLKAPFVNHALLVHGDILLRRGDPVSARQMFERGKEFLRREVSVAIFPEGTRLKSGEMNRFKEGAFKLAQMAGVAILPVAIDGTGDPLVGWKLRRLHTFRLHVLPPISAETVAENDAQTLAAMARERIEVELQKMKI